VSSIRSRLALRVVGLVVASVGVYAIAAGVVRQGAASREALEELEQDARLRGDIVLQIVKQVGTASFMVGLAGREIGGPPKVALDAIPGFIVVFDQAGSRIYSSPTVKVLDDVQEPSGGAAGPAIRVSDRQAFDAAVQRALTSDTSVRFLLRRDEGRLLRRADFEGRQVVVGISLPDAVAPWRELFISALFVLPFVLLLAGWTAYVLAGDVLRPVDSIRQEVEAITDGRSLHRRVALGSGVDEMSRLAATLNEMIQRLETSFGALRRFTADASHELKTPLAVLRADVERAMAEKTRSTDQMVALEEALQETRRMSDLVDSLLTLARADEGRFDLYREAIDLGSLVRDVAETANILGENAGIAVSLNAFEPANVMGDATRLRQLFLNLVTNAIKYTPRGGKVDLSLQRRDSHVCFTVKDTGIGISAADVPFVFERFWRADRVRSRTAERGGFGLGLAISQWIAQAHGGTLTVQSRLHRGSTFEVTLPVEEVG
jgi:signal transduction histidine kinase